VSRIRTKCVLSVATMRDVKDSGCVAWSMER